MGSKEEANWLLSYAAFTCWHRWKARCNYLYNQTAITPQQVTLSLSSSARAFLEASRTPTENSIPVQATPSCLVCWSPPGSPFTKLNVDAN